MPPHTSFSIIFLHLSTNYSLGPSLPWTRIYCGVKPTACNTAAGLHRASSLHPFVAHGRTSSKAHTLGQVHEAHTLGQVHEALKALS